MGAMKPLGAGGRSRISPTLFTGVRGRTILRSWTSALRGSGKFAQLRSYTERYAYVQGGRCGFPDIRNRKYPLRGMTRSCSAGRPARVHTISAGIKARSVRKKVLLGDSA